GKPLPGDYPETDEVAFSARFVDMDGDRRMDVVYRSGEGIAVRFGLYGATRFSAHAGVSIGSTAQSGPSFIRGRFGEGRPLATASGRGVALVGKAYGGLRAGPVTDLGRSVNYLAACDLDDDGVD